MYLSRRIIMHKFCNPNICNNMRPEIKTAKSLLQRQMTISTAESCTGGLLAHRLTNVPGSSGFFIGGLTVYANSTKVTFLKIPPKTIAQYGAVSEPVARLMAQGIRRSFKTDIGIGITGIAGPSGGSKLKPVGTVFIAISTKNTTLSQKFLFKGSRLQNKQQATTAALNLLLGKILKP